MKTVQMRLEMCCEVNVETRVLLSFHENPRATMKEVLEFVEKAQAELPDQEIFMDGDLYAIVSRPKKDVSL